MSTLQELLAPTRLTHVVNVGANPFDVAGTPPYLPMFEAGLCHVTGFEPEPAAFQLLQNGPKESYLPYALGDGNPQTLRVCTAESGMTSLFEPDPATLGLFAVLEPLANVIERIPLDTHRLDDVAEIAHLDFLKIDVQGSELAVFQHGRQKLAEAVAIQVEVSFITLYQDQPPFGAIDVELRQQGFVPHCFAEVKKWPIAPFAFIDAPRQPLNQLLEADIVYVRDIAHPDTITDEQLKHLALIAHHCYGSFDLALRCVMLLEQRLALAAGSHQRYLDAANSRTPPWTEPLAWRQP